MRARAIAHEALELSIEQRAACLERLCGGDAELLAEASWLVEAGEDDALDTIPDEVHAATRSLAADWHLQSASAGSYRLIEPIGEGGMGVVWLAEREVGRTRQRVALKRLRADAVAHRARLIEERSILASLVHPNIACLLEGGEDRDGVPFLAMEYVDGERIDRWCSTRNLGLRARLGLFVKTCAAVSYAHQQLVIHRDIKPANVLVDANGEPKLLDFGIARLIEPDRLQRTATRLMTPAYASPEQIEGRPLGTATDVWSLGVLLHEMLSGHRPLRHFDSDHARAIMLLSGEAGITGLASDTPSENNVTPEAHAVRIPPDIDAIVRKALRREPEQRYASVREMAEDIERFLASRPVLARRGLWSYRAQRFMQRNRWPIAAVMALMTVVAGFTWRTAVAEREARLQAVVADSTTEFLISTFALADPSQAGRHDYSAREVLDRGRERVETELVHLPRVQARLFEALGNAYRGINEGSAGASLLEAAAQLNLGPEVNDPLAAARSLRAKAAAVEASRGSTQLSEDAARRAFDLVERHGGNNPLLLADAHAALADALNHAAKEELAIAAAREALRLREAGSAAPLVLAQSHVDLCAALGAAGHSAAALPHCERARSMYADAGATHTNEYRLALRTLDGTLSYLGQHERATTLARERLALTAELFGEDSAVLASERVWLTVRLGELGLFAEATALLEQGMPVILARNGPDSTQYARGLFCQGWLEYQQGRFALGLPLLRRAVSIQQAQVAGRDLGTLHVLRTTLAQVLIESGQADAEARALLESVITERVRAGSTANTLAYARLPMAQWHAANGNVASALDLLEQVAAVGDGVEKELHARAAATRSTVLATQGDLPGAATAAGNAYAIMRADHGNAHPRTILYALAYARAARAVGDADTAQALEREYRPELARVFPPDSAHRR